MKPQAEPDDMPEFPRATGRLADLVRMWDSYTRAGIIVESRDVWRLEVSTWWEMRSAGEYLALAALLVLALPCATGYGIALLIGGAR